MSLCQNVLANARWCSESVVVCRGDGINPSAEGQAAGAKYANVQLFRRTPASYWRTRRESLDREMVCGLQERDENPSLM